MTIRDDQTTNQIRIQSENDMQIEITKDLRQSFCIFIIKKIAYDLKRWKIKIKIS